MGSSVTGSKVAACVDASVPTKHVLKTWNVESIDGVGEDNGTGGTTARERFGGI